MKKPLNRQYESTAIFFIDAFTYYYILPNTKIYTSIASTDPNLFFIVAEGSVEIHAILPTQNKKTDNIREFLCKKDKGDMVYIPSVRKLIAESNAKEVYERETRKHKEHTSHKNVLDLIDTVSMNAVGDTTILQLDWTLFHSKFGHSAERPADSKLDVNMLLTIMQTNLTDYLSYIPVLDSISHSKLETLSRLCHYCVKKEGSVICKEGDVDDEVFIVLSGEVKVEAMATKHMLKIMDGFDVPKRSSIFDRSSSSENIGKMEKEDSSKRKASVNYNCDYVENDRSQSSLSEINGDVCKRKSSATFGSDYIESKNSSVLVESKRDVKDGICLGKENSNTNKKNVSKGQKTLDKRLTMLSQAGNDLRRDLAKRKLASALISSSVVEERTVEEKRDMEVERSTLKERTDNPANIDSAEDGDMNKTVELAVLGPGDYFGEMATFIELPRAATVTAISNVLLAALSKTNFRTLYHAISPDLESRVEGLVKCHMLQNIFQLNSPFLERIPVKSSNSMAQKTSIAKLEAGSVVFNEGEEANRFYFVYSGTLSVDKTSEGGTSRRIGLLYPGDYFGEMALLMGSKRLATITATTATVVIEITRNDFCDAFKSTPWLISEFVVRMKGRHVDLASLVEYSTAREVFADFLRKEEWDGGATGGVANLTFFEDVTAFEREWSGTGMTLGSWKAAKDIVDKYFSNCRPLHFLDLPTDIAQPVMEIVKFDKEGEIESSTFLEAKAVVVSRLEGDALPKFKKTREFEIFMDRMRVYDEVDKQMLA